MPCKCGSEKKENAPDQFVIYRSDVSAQLIDVDDARGEKFAPRLTTSNATGFAPRSLLPIDAFDTVDFCSKPPQSSYVPVILGGADTLTAAAHNYLIRKYWNDYCRCKPTCIPPKFEGGQCCGVPYKVTIVANEFATDGYNATYTHVVNFTGKLRDVGVEVRQGFSGQNVTLFVKTGEGLDCTFPVEYVPAASALNPRPTITFGMQIISIGVARRDGLPDTCGNPPSPYEPPYFPDIYDVGFGDSVPLPIPPNIVEPVSLPVFVPVAPSDYLPVSRDPDSPLLYLPPDYLPPVVAPNPAPNPPNGSPCICAPPPPPIVRLVPVPGESEMVDFVELQVPIVKDETDGSPGEEMATIKVVANKDGESEADAYIKLFEVLKELRKQGVSASAGGVQPVLLGTYSVTLANPVFITPALPNNVRSVVIKVTAALGSVPRQYVVAGSDSEYLLGHVSFWSEGAMLLPRYELSTLTSRIAVPHSSKPLSIRFSARFFGTVQIFDSGERWNRVVNQ